MGLISIPGILASGRKKLTWTAASSPGFGTTVIRSVRYGNGIWVATAQSGKIRYAVDPAGTWLAASSPGFGADDIFKVEYGNGDWVACSLQVHARTTTDPTGTWDSAGNADLMGSSMTANTYGNKWMIAGGSADGTTAVDPTGSWAINANFFGTKNCIDLAWDGTTWIGVGNDTILRTATDPDGVWVDRTSGFVGSEDLSSVQYDGFRYYVAVGTNAVSTTLSPVGTWTRNTDLTLAAPNPATSVDYGGGLWVVVTQGAAGGKIYSTRNPSSEWTENTHGFTASIRGVAYGADGNWVAVGDGGLIEVGT